MGGDLVPLGEGGWTILTGLIKNVWVFPLCDLEKGGLAYLGEVAAQVS